MMDQNLLKDAIGLSGVSVSAITGPPLRSNEPLLAVIAEARLNATATKSAMVRL
jgi:hypothetical protein